MGHDRQQWVDSAGQPPLSGTGQSDLGGQRSALLGADRAGTYTSVCFSHFKGVIDLDAKDASPCSPALCDQAVAAQP